MCWAKPHMREQNEQWAKQILFAGLRGEESDEFARFRRMETAHFDYILEKNGSCHRMVNMLFCDWLVVTTNVLLCCWPAYTGDVAQSTRVH